jgi:putative ABC transport system substrate-binding protein
VASLSRPGGNATGLSNMAVDLTKKRIEIARDIIPGLSRVAMLVNASDEVGSRAFIADGEAAARQLGITVVPVGVRGRDDLEGAISKISEEKFQAVAVTIDGLFFVERCFGVAAADNRAFKGNAGRWCTHILWAKHTWLVPPRSLFHR